MREVGRPDGGDLAEVGPSDAGVTEDSGAHSSCAPFVACGGDLIGTWKIVSNCHDPPVEQAGCESLQYSAEVSQGTFDFSDAGVFREDYVSSFHLVTVVPAGCITSSCADFQADNQAHIASIGSGTVSCSASDGGCRCETDEVTRQSSSAPYSVNGSTVRIVVDPTRGSFSESEYCVIGDQLTLHRAGIGSSTFSRN